MKLTEEQQNFIRENYMLISDLIELTRQVFNDNTLDGRTKEGRAVRKYLVDNDLEYKTTEKQKKRRYNIFSRTKRIYCSICERRYECI